MRRFLGGAGLLIASVGLSLPSIRWGLPLTLAGLVGLMAYTGWTLGKEATRGDYLNS